MKKFYCLLMLGIINMGYGLGMFIDSFSVVDDGFGFDISSNFDYFVWFISGLIIIIFSIFYYQDLKKQNSTK